MSKKFGMQVIFGSSNLSPNNGPFLAVLHCPCSPGPYKIKLFFSPTRGAAVKFKPKRGKGILQLFSPSSTLGSANKKYEREESNDSHAAEIGIWSLFLQTSNMGGDTAAALTL